MNGTTWAFWQYSGQSRCASVPRDPLSYVAAGANHGATIGLLTPPEAATATAAVQRWAGLGAAIARTATAEAAPYEEVLDACNPALDRRAGLRR